MRRIMMALGLLLLALVPAEAQQVTGIEIVEHGIYTTDITGQQSSSSGIVNQTVANAKLALTTTTVAMQKGVEFGFRYRISGTPADATVQIRKVVVFPAPGLTPPGKPTVRQNELPLTRHIGGTFYAGYSLDDPFELVPGKWTFQLWWNNRKMAEQSFTVVAQKR